MCVYVRVSVCVLVFVCVCVRTCVSFGVRVRDVCFVVLEIDERGPQRTARRTGDLNERTYRRLGGGSCRW